MTRWTENDSRDWPKYWYEVFNMPNHKMAVMALKPRCSLTACSLINTLTVCGYASLDARLVFIPLSINWLQRWSKAFVTVRDKRKIFSYQKACPTRGCAKFSNSKATSNMMDIIFLQMGCTARQSLQCVFETRRSGEVM
jgi:hypothetical protein